MVTEISGGCAELGVKRKACAERNGYMCRMHGQGKRVSEGMAWNTVVEIKTKVILFLAHV